MRPVTILPGYNFGEPAIARVRCENIAGRVMAGDSVEATAEDFSLTPAEVCLACWYVATYPRGRSKRFAAWLGWAESVYGALSKGKRPSDDPPVWR